MLTDTYVKSIKTYSVVGVTHAVMGTPFRAIHTVSSPAERLQKEIMANIQPPIQRYSKAIHPFLFERGSTHSYCCLL
jgi:hypothetical protein